MQKKIMKNIKLREEMIKEKRKYINVEQKR